MGIYAGPRERCCEAFDYVEVRTSERHLAVCLACDRVFCDVDLPATPRPRRRVTGSGGPG